LTGSITSPTYAITGLVYSIYSITNDICTYMVCYNSPGSSESAGAGTYIVHLPVPIDNTVFSYGSTNQGGNNIGFGSMSASGFSAGTVTVTAINANEAFVFINEYPTPLGLSSSNPWSSTAFNLGGNPITLSFVISYPVVAATTGSTALTFCLGGADDFMLGYQLGIPRNTVTLP